MKSRAIKKTVDNSYDILKKIQRSIDTMNHSSNVMSETVVVMSSAIKDMNEDWNSRHNDFIKNQDKWMKMFGGFTATLLLIIAGMLGLRVV